MEKIYTRTGDDGITGLWGGARVPKDHVRIEALGALDEANSALGVVASHLEHDLAAIVWEFQRTLFEIGAELAAPDPGEARVPSLPAGAVDALERCIDGWAAEVEPLRAFILPGGSGPAALCHMARAVVRRAERRTVTLAHAAPVNPEILRYLNRLSDGLFVLARLVNRRAGVADRVWEGRQT
jgi:cob(I)alamin adenosyltransferase